MAQGENVTHERMISHLTRDQSSAESATHVTEKHRNALLA